MKSKRTTPIANANDPIEAFRKMAYWFHNRGWACFLNATPNREPYVMAHTDGKVASALIVGQVDGQTKTMNFKVRLGIKIPAYATSKVQAFIDQANAFALAPIELIPELQTVAASARIQLTNIALEDAEIDRAIMATCQTIDRCAHPILSIIFANDSIEQAVENFKLASQTDALPDPEVNGDSIDGQTLH